MPTRYASQIALPEIGEEGQKRLNGSSVLCIGAGGLGSPALLYLAAAGIGRIGIADFDVVEESNLQRQVLFSTDQIGDNKAQAAAIKLRALNPEPHYESHNEGLHEGNVEELFSSYDLILDGTDHFAAKFMINDACVKYQKPFISAALSQFEGQVAVFDPRVDDAPCYRCLYPEEPQQQILNCAQAGVLGAVAGMIGTMQASQALLFLASENQTEFLHKLWTIDARSMKTRLLTLKRDRSCPVCSRNKDEIILSYKRPICGQIGSVEARDYKAHPQTILLDVREQDEWDAGHIEGALFFPLSRIVQGKMPDIDKDASIILYCAAGVRSYQAAQMMQANGFSNLTNMEGGYYAWTSFS